MAPQRESAAEVIREVAAEKGSPLTEVALVCNMRRDQFGSETQAFRLRTPGGAYNAKLPLLGKHQLDNAATAILAVEALRGSGIEIGAEAVKSGLESVKWPARIETIKRRPTVIVDSAHTADSARRLRDTLEEYLHVRNATLVVGVMGDKDLEGLASAIEPVARRVIATKADHPRALDSRSVGRAFQDLGLEVMYDERLGRAIDTALNLSTPSDAVVILGSIALAGEARAHLLGLEYDPPMAG
jgi:dihydrofolate synthase/folylpolyglutamate synthase